MIKPRFIELATSRLEVARYWLGREQWNTYWSCNSALTYCEVVQLMRSGRLVFPTFHRKRKVAGLADLSRKSSSSPAEDVPNFERNGPIIFDVLRTS
jgi:hypothetical protein